MDIEEIERIARQHAVPPTLVDVCEDHDGVLINAHRFGRSASMLVTRLELADVYSPRGLVISRTRQAVAKLARNGD